MIISGKTALVTGGSRGIGASVAQMLTAEGAKVAIAYHNSKEAAEDVAHRIELGGGEAHLFAADLRQPDDIGRLANEVEDWLGPIKILINCAGAIYRPGSWNEQVLEKMDATYELNLRSTILLIKRLAPPMIEAKEGAIINFSSTVALTGAAAVLAYGAAKAGLLAVSRAMARDLAPNGVRVNAVLPGNIDTDMTRGAGDDVVDWAINTTPLGRLGTVQEISQGVKFLIENDFMVGHELIIDGGQILNV